MQTYSGIILAAGESRRIPTCKQLLKIHGKAMIEIVVEKAIKSRLDEVIVVLGHEFKTIQGYVKKYVGLAKPLKIVYNPDFKNGLSTSLKAGLKAVSSESGAVIFILADQPLIQVKTINQLMEVHSSMDCLIVVPTYRGRRGNPVLVDRKLFGEIFKLKGDIGARPLIKRYVDRVVYVATDDLGVIADIDTIEDYSALVAGKFGRR
ncbi:MAG: hypothetical protein DRN68_01150 [Thaumarchaeota archaeon]|nr:MAG: hypothetical protein DRN68_01150 [Nitrososphaerota archaeon]